MTEELIGYLKFNDFVDELVDNQIWMQRIENFTKRHPRNKNDDQIFDPYEGKVRTKDGVIDYTELMDIDSPNLKKRCYIASFTRIYKSNFEKNGRIKTNIAYNLHKLAGSRDFVVMESGNSRESSLEAAVNSINMSPRKSDPNIPLGYLDAKGKIQNYAQQVILYDTVLQAFLKITSPAIRAKMSKDWDPKYQAFSILSEITKEDASEHIKSLGTQRVATLIKNLDMRILQKFMRNMDTNYIKKLKPLISQEKTNALIKAIDLQRCNPLKPSNLKLTMEVGEVTYTDKIISETRQEAIQKARKDEEYRDDLLKKCIWEKPYKYITQQESRIVLIASETTANQKFPCIMNLQYYKEPLSPTNDGSEQYLLPIQAQKIHGCFIYYLRSQYFRDLHKSITEESNIRAYPIG